jgi:RHS repeat-associated protein
VGVLYRDGCRVTHTFDAARRQTLMADLMGETLYGHDATGRVTNVAYPTGLALTDAFDALGQRLWMLDPNAGRTTYSYDQQGRLSGILNPFNEQTTITHDALDRELHKILANGMAVSHTYDPAGTQTVLENRKSDGTLLAVYTATYDGLGNRLTVLELDGVRVTYGYDATSQLTQEQRSGANTYDTSYQYDPVGNRLVKDDSGALTTYSYNVADELTLIQPPTGQPTTMSWDANGNLAVENAGGGLTTHTWDDENRLIGIAYPDGKLHTYAYAVNGLRQRKETEQGTAIFVWDGQTVLLETGADLVTQVHYTDSPGYWGGLVSQRRSGATSFYGFDLQTSTRVLVSSAEQTTDAYDLKAFGEELAATGATTNTLRYAGQFGYYRDSDERLYVRARHLEVTRGRWSSRDPYGWVLDEPNAYAYVRNAPSRWADPTGLAVDCGQISTCLKSRPASTCGCPAKGKHSYSDEFLTCLFWQESTFQTSNPGGIGTLTSVAITQLCQWGCNFGIRERADAEGKNWCDGAVAASRYLECVGIEKYGPPPGTPGHYGTALQKKLRDCESCLKAGKPCMACMHLVHK